MFRERGSSSRTGIAFTEDNVTKFSECEPMAAPGQACLALAWQNRATLLHE